MAKTILALLLIFSTHSSAFQTADKVEQNLSTETSRLLENEKNTIQIFKESSPLVVSVDNTQLRADFFSRDFKEVPAGSGTGFIWDSEGHIVTNYHVIRGSSQTKIFINTKDGKRYPAKIIGAEPRKDIAILKVKQLKGKYDGFSKKLSNSKKLIVGQKVLAIGSPFGFDMTLTEGIISALNRSMPSLLPNYTIRGMIQTDASINPGNSGGPLISSQGQLVGMNTAIISGSGSSAGIGFAVPANSIQRIAQQIIRHGEVIQPGLGISVVSEYGRQYFQRLYGKEIKGVIVEKAFGNAKKAGLKGIRKDYNGRASLGDVITKVDGKTIEDIDDLYNLLSEKKVGEKVDVGFIRNKKYLNRMIALQKLPSPFKQIP